MEKVTSSATLKLWLFFCLHYSVCSSLLPSPILLWVSEGEETETHIYEHGNKHTSWFTLPSTDACFSDASKSRYKVTQGSESPIHLQHQVSQDAPLCPPRIHHKSNHIFHNRVGSCTTQWCALQWMRIRFFSHSKMKGKRHIKPVKSARKRLFQDWQALICSTTVITTHASPWKHQEPDTLGIPSVCVFVFLNVTSQPPSPRIKG